MLIHVNDAVTLQGARALRQPLIIPYGIHQEYELQIVTGHDNAPVDVESRGCVKWTLTITPSPENPTKVLAYAVFAENIATGSYLRFDFAATSVEMYKHVAGNPATPAVLQLQGFTEEDAPATLVIALPVALVTTAQQRLPVDLSTALMQELQLAVSVVGAAQREISKYMSESTDAADRAELAATNAHASEVNAERSATAAGMSAVNARNSEQNAAGSADAAAGSAADALASQNAAHDSEVAAKASEDAAALSESNAHDSEVAAKASEDAAALSASNAHDSEVAAKASEDAALASQNAAHASEVAAKGSEDAALASQNAAHASEVAAKASEDAAHDSEVAAKASEDAAALSESNAHNSEVAAKASEDAAALSESNAKDSEDAAKASENAAALSESNAHGSELAAADSAADALASQNAAADSAAEALASQNAAAGSAAAALASQGAAHDSEVAAAASQADALASKNAAAQSESNALGYKNAASQSAANAHDSEVAAKASEDAAALSAQHAASAESDAAGSATAAEQSAVSAYNSKNDAEASATAAHNSEVNAKASETKVEQDAAEAASSAAAAEQSEQDAAAQAKLSESWAKGDTGVRDDEDTNNAKYWAEQARQASPDGKADKVVGAVDGHLAGLDSTGNLTDSGIPSDNVALQDGSYDTLHSGTAGNLVDNRAPSTNRKFGFDTACGDVSISDDGTADPTLLKGTTYVKNQLVGDSKVVKELGQSVVTSPVSVAGDIDHAYIKGRSLVRNQLVPASVEKEGSSSNGVVEVTDAVAGDALALKMTAPRSVVMNQRMNWSANVAAISGSTYMTVSKDTTNQTLGMEVLIPTTANGLRVEVSLPRQHILAVHGIVTASSYGFTSQIGVASRGTVAQKYISQSNNTLFGKISINNDAYVSNLFIYASFLQAQPAGWTYSIKDLTVVDLTQYFNGDQTLIDSITSWDDLVVYDPRFAQYVEYNTGEVVGVQPTVQVTGKNLFDTANAVSLYDTYTNAFNSAMKGNNYVEWTAKLSLDTGSWSYNAHYKMFIVTPQYLGNYVMSCDIQSSSNQYAAMNSSGVVLCDSDGSNRTEIGTKTRTDNHIVCQFTVTSSMIGRVIALRMYVAVNSTYPLAIGDTYKLYNIQLELGSTATAYEPYHDGGTAQAPAPLFAVGNAADEFEAVAGGRVENVRHLSLPATGWSTYSSGVWKGFSIGPILPVVENRARYISSNALIPSLITASPVAPHNIVHLWIGVSELNVYVVWDYNNVTPPSAWLTDGELDASKFMAWLASNPVDVYYATGTPVTSTSTPTQISLQAGSNVAMQTDGGRIASSIALGYDGTSFDVPLKTGRSYLVKKGSTSTLVTDGTTQSVTGGQDMIVDLNTLYNNVSSLITPIADWSALVSDTGMYGSYTAYDEGTVVHSDQTTVKACGKNLFDISSNSTYLGGISNDKAYRIPNSGAISSPYTTTTAFRGVCIVMPVIEGKTYAISSDVSGHNQIYNGFYKEEADCTVLSKCLGKQSGSTFTVPNGAAWVVIAWIANNANKTLTWSQIQLELGSTATSYEPYYSGGTATAGPLKGVPGSVYDQLDAVTGNVTTRIGSYTFTGNESWTKDGTLFIGSDIITNAYRQIFSVAQVNYMMAGYTAVPHVTSVTTDMVFEVNGNAHSVNKIYLRDSSCADAAALNAKLAGRTVYYRLATYTKSTTTPQPLTQQTGGLTVLQTAGTLPVNLDVRHAVSEWDEPIVRNCKYIFRDNGEDSLVTGSTTVTYKHVVGGQHKLINLTQWFGRNREPSVADFYKLFPTWKDADIPYDRGTILNYKGTGVRTIGFNAYNHATGTAVLLGGNKYQICGTYTSCTYTDQWGNAEELDIDDKGIFTPVNNGTLTVVGGNDTDTCVHLCWSGYKDYGKPDYEWFPYEEKGVEWDLSQWFPNGMNGIGTVQDEMMNNSMTRKCGTYIINGTENIYRESYYWIVPTTQTGNGVKQDCFANNGFCYTGNTGILATWGQIEQRVAGNGFVLGDADNDFDTVDDLKEWLTENPITVIYPLATPVTSDVTPTQNFSYPVNDFGTEQSLPVNTLTLLSTDLDADIRYSLDFTRTVANYSKIENDVKDLVEEKDNLARQDGNYADKGGTYTYATQLLDPNAPPTEASYGNRTAAGDVSIADNGTADVTSLQGTTQIQNQLVHDTNMNTKSSVDGRLVLTDAVGGQLSRLEIHGGCVVHNQLVKESVEKTATGTGRLGCEDGVAGNAKSLIMTAPRSVVMNQLMTDKSRFISLATGLTISTARNDDYSFSITWNNSNSNAVSASVGITDATSSRPSHRLLALSRIIESSGDSASILLYINQSGQNSFWNKSAIINLNSTQTGTVIVFRIPENSSGSATFIIQMVDLTQYFNGNTTLINSISTWDDLVAYDSTFASYVAYNTGTVQGVQPTVKVNHTTDVACPVELFGGSNSYTDAGDSFDAVSGVFTKQFDTYTFTGNETWTYYNTGTAETDPFWYVNNICSGAVTAGVSYLSNGKIGTVFNNGQLRVRLSVNSGITDSSDMNNIFPVGTKLVYQLAEPVTSQYNPTTIPVVDIYNTALQTVGTRSCGLSLTYDGKDQTIALNPSHTYVFNDNQEDDSVITGQSSIDAVGGEDQLVNITQLYNGDASKIANIHSWASLSTRFHRYRDFLPYNPGTVEPDTPVIRVFPDEHAYGIIYDPSQNLPACQWVELNNGVLTEVASFSDFSETPCHNLYRCVMSDLANRTIAYYLDDEDSDKKYNGTRNGVTSDGTASVLTGADGDVETEMPIGYWDLDEDWEGTGKRLWLISDRPFMGSYYPAEIHDFFYVSPDGSTPRKQYVGSYRGCICDADGNPLNTTEGALAQVTGTSSTNKVRSIKGALPYVNVSLNDFTVKSGRNGGSSVNVKYHQWLFLLMAIEYGTLDNQAISYGYAGGIQNAFCFWRKSGRVNAGNGTAELKAVEGTQDMDNFQKFTVGSTTVQRDTLMDADGRYAWSIHNRNASSTRYFTSSPTPSNGDPVYTASTGTTTAGTVASYTLQSNRTIQFQYRGIENPFGEVWEFEHGIQKFQTGSLKSFRGTDNLTYTRDPLSDGPSSYAWKNTSDTVLWTNTAAPGTSTTMYSDAALTTSVTTKYKDQPYYRYSSEGYWETLATSDYTMTAQRTAQNPVYTVRHNHWPLSGWDTKFDPVTFFMRKTGSPGASGRYLPDYWYNDGVPGDRVAYVGGYASIGSFDGLGARSLYNGLPTSGVTLSGRPSA